MTPDVLAFEIHYTPQQLAALWGLSDKTIHRWFQDEPGVLKTSDKGRTFLRIPGTVAARVHNQRSRAALDEFKPVCRRVK